MKLEKLYRSHAEAWTENKTSIILKMLGDSLKTKDNIRMDALQRSLLNIEHAHTTETNPIQQTDEDANDNFILPPSDFSLGKYILTYKTQTMVLKVWNLQNQAKRNLMENSQSQRKNT